MITITAVGRLAAQPELKVLPNMQVCEFRLLSTRFSRGQEHTEAVTFVCFGEDAEEFAATCVKGQEISATGVQETQMYTPPNGTPRQYVKYRLTWFKRGRKPYNGERSEGQNQGAPDASDRNQRPQGNAGPGYQQPQRSQGNDGSGYQSQQRQQGQPPSNRQQPSRDGDGQGGGAAPGYRPGVRPQASQGYERSMHNANNGRPAPAAPTGHQDHGGYGGSHEPPYGEFDMPSSFNDGTDFID